MKNRFSNIAMIVIAALVISTFAAMSCTKAQAHDSISSVATTEATPEIRTEPAALTLTTNRLQFLPKFIATRSIPNFAQSIRRAPIRRKGRVRH